MKNKTKNIFRTALVFILLSCLLMSVACTGKREAALAYSGDNSVGLSYYELMLSRMRGTLSRSGYDVNDPEFWGTDSGVDGKTYEEYYNDMILDGCKTAVAALELFDELELSLPNSYLASIDEDIEFLISYDGEDSEEQLNNILAPYGVNVDSLREAYIVEAKISYIKAYIYGDDASLIGDTVKDEFYRENYHRFKQILVRNYFYCYEEDEFGTEIYFNSETGHILYDKKNGEPKFDKDDNYITDKFGTPIYYGDDGKIVYDKENGVRAILKDDNGNALPFYYSPVEMAERYNAVKAEFDKLEDGDEYAFEELIEKYSDAESNVYTRGSYVGDIEKSGYDEYLTDILDKLNEMKVGETAIVESEYGYHMIMKYELDDGAYSDDVHKDWFTSMNSSLIEKMFLERCKSGMEKVNIDSEILGNARSITEVGTNFYY